MALRVGQWLAQATAGRARISGFFAQFATAAPKAKAKQSEAPAEAAPEAKSKCITPVVTCAAEEEEDDQRSTRFDGRRSVADQDEVKKDRRVVKKLALEKIVSKSSNMRWALTRRPRLAEVRPARAGVLHDRGSGCIVLSER